MATPLQTQIQIAGDALTRLAEIDRLMREGGGFEFRENHEAAKREAARLTAAAAEIERLLREAW